MAKSIAQARAEYARAFKRKPGSVGPSDGRVICIGMARIAPFGVYLKGECIADYGDDKAAAAKHYSLLVSVHRVASQGQLIREGGLHG